MSALGDLGTFLKGEREGVTLELDNKLNAIAPYSGYLAVSKKLDNFYFQTSSSFIASMADKNRYVKFLDKVVDTWGQDKTDDNWIYTAGNSGVSTSSIDETSITLEGRTYDGYYDAITLEVGVYRIQCNIINPTNSEARIYVGTSIAGAQLVEKRQTSDFDFELIVTTTTNVFVECRLGNHTNKIIFTKPSVRKIQSINLSNYIPEVLVQEEATNGLTLQSSVNAGDYVVVDRKELVTNGKFDTTNNWVIYEGTSLDTTNNQGKITGIAISQGINTVIGKEYFLSYELINDSLGSSPNVVLYMRSTQFGTNVAISDYQTFGKHTFKFTATTSITYIEPQIVSGSYAIVDNISVKQVDETYRAKIDAPIGTSLTNTTYFEVRDSIGVTNQIGVFHKYNLLTNSYEGLSAEILFSDVSKEDLLDNPTWLARNGFSKAGEFCYSKGTYLYLPVSIWQTLNKGAQHPVFNGFGVSYCNSNIVGNGKPWYDSATYDILSVADSFNPISSNNPTITPEAGYLTFTGYVGSANTRPDSKYHDIVYPDQVIDVREYAKILNKWEVDLIRADKEENGVEEIVSFKYSDRNTGTLDTLNIAGGNRRRHYSTSVSSQHISNKEIYTDSTQTIYAVNSVDSVAYKLYGVLYFTTGTYLDFDPSYGTTFTPSASSYTVLIVDKKPVLSSNTKLSTDLLCNPINYPQIMKDRLAEGKVIIGLNPLLVDDLGNNLIPDGTSKNYKVSNKSITTFVGIYSTNNGLTYVVDPGMVSEFNYISNARLSWAPATGFLMFINYTSKNNPYTQTTPKAVVEVLPKVKASNSHSIYKGALVGNQVVGKVQVGSGANGYESKVLENATNISTYLSSDGLISLATGDTILVVDGHLGDIGNKGVVGTIYKYKASTYYPSIDTNVLRYSNTSLYDIVSTWVTTPTHSTISLDNSNSPASKWFEVLEEENNGVLAGVYGQEVVYGADTGNFANLSNGTTVDFSNNTIRTFHGSIALNGKIK